MRIGIKHSLVIAALLCGGAAFPFSGVPAFAQSQAAAAEIRFQELEKEIRRLTGQIEEQNYEIRRLRDELDAVRQGINSRFGEEGAERSDAPVSLGGPQVIEEEEELVDAPAAVLESDPEPQAGGAQISASDSEGQILGTISQSAQGGDVSSKDGAPRAYDYAYSFIKARDFERAEKEFATFLRDYSDSDLAANAQYWYGETFYVRGNYDRAARAFAQGYQDYPKGSKAASNLLKLGMSLAGLGKSDDACIAFKQLKKEYSDSSLPVLNRTESEMKKIDCQ